MAAIAFPGFLLTLAAFVLLLLTTLTTPVIKSLYFLQVYVDTGSSTLTDATGHLNLGTFGYCSTGLTATALSALTTSITSSGCTAVKLGYTLSADLFVNIQEVAGIDLSGIDTSIIKTLTYLLVLQPIAAGFAGVSFIFAALAFFCSSRFAEIFAFICTILASIIAWIAFAVTMALFAIAKSRIHSASEGYLNGRLGNAIWMDLAAAIILTVSLCFICVGMFGPYSHRRRAAQSGNRDMSHVGTDPNAAHPFPANEKRGKFPWSRRKHGVSSTY